MSIPLGTTTTYAGSPLAPVRASCICPEMPRRPGHNTPTCPACRAYQRREPMPPRVPTQLPLLTLAVLEQAVATAITQRSIAFHTWKYGYGTRGAYERARTKVETCQRRLKKARERGAL